MSKEERVDGRCFNFSHPSITILDMDIPRVYMHAFYPVLFVFPHMMLL